MGLSPISTPAQKGGCSASRMTFQRTRSADRAVVASTMKNPPTIIGRWAFDWGLSSEDPLQVYEAWCVCRRVEVASPGGLGPSFRIAIARIAAAGGAFTFEDEVDPTKFARGVTDGATGLVISSGHGRIGSGTASQRLSAARLSTWRWISRN